MSAPHPASIEYPALAEARERAFRVLTDCYADDTLPVAEFEARLDRVYAAGTPAAIADVVGDLPASAPAATALRPNREWVPGARASDPAHAPLAVPALGPVRHPVGVGDRLATDRTGGDRLLAVFAERRYTGAWGVPARLMTRACFAELTLDLREALLPPDCTIDVGAAFTEVRVLLPPGVAVDCRMSPVLASVDDRSAPTDEGLPYAIVRLTGTVVFTQVSIRTAPRGAQALPFGQAWRRARRPPAGPR